PLRLEVGDLVIDVAEHTVRRGRREIDLTATEFSFLAHLARNAGRVVSRAEILKHVWDDSSSYSNVIDVYASRVRRKIDDGEKAPLFTTLRGMGFTLRTPPEKPAKRATHGRATRKTG
ncbi:MAG TPA: winged helix-turn-helix domain-containing protein, partial [Gemmatimonadaceae bacterium]